MGPGKQLYFSKKSGDAGSTWDPPEDLKRGFSGRLYSPEPSSSEAGENSDGEPCAGGGGGVADTSAGDLELPEAADSDAERDASRVQQNSDRDGGPCAGGGGGVADTSAGDLEQLDAADAERDASRVQQKPAAAVGAGRRHRTPQKSAVGFDSPMGSDSPEYKKLRSHLTDRRRTTGACVGNPDVNDARLEALDLPVFPPDDLVLGSRVIGYFSDGNWYPGRIVSITLTKKGRDILRVEYDDDDVQEYTSKEWKDLRHDSEREKKENLEIYHWNIVHHFISIRGPRPGVKSPLTGVALTESACHELLIKIRQQQCKSYIGAIRSFLQSCAVGAKKTKLTKDVQWALNVNQFLSETQFGSGQDPLLQPVSPAATQHEGVQQRKRGIRHMLCFDSNSRQSVIPDSPTGTTAVTPDSTTTAAAEVGGEQSGTARSPAPSPDAASSSAVDIAVIAVRSEEEESESGQKKRKLGSEDSEEEAQPSAVTPEGADLEMPPNAGTSQGADLEMPRGAARRGNRGQKPKKTDVHAGEMSGCNTKKPSSKASSKQATLDGFLARKGICLKCGAPGRLFCTAKNGASACNVSLCGECMGLDSTVACPRNFLCELHRKGSTARGPTLKFAGKFCFECGRHAWGGGQGRNDLIQCPHCDKNLCLLHAVVTKSPAVKQLFTKDQKSESKLCRQCSASGEEFTRWREEAAHRFLDRLLGTRGITILSVWQVQDFVTALKKQNGQQLRKSGPVYNAAHEFCAFVFALICSGLCYLAERLIEILVNINLALRIAGVGMAVLPGHFFYMICPDPRKKANGHMMALVSQSFAADIVEKEIERRKLEGQTRYPDYDYESVVMPRGLDCEQQAEGEIERDSDSGSRVVGETPPQTFGKRAAGDKIRMRIALYGFDLLDNSPTHDLLFGEIKYFLGCDDCDFLLVVKSELSEAESKTPGRYPYGRAYKPAAELADACGDRVLYLWKDWSDCQIVEALLARNLHVFIHANGLNHAHIYHALAMAQVALLIIEWLSFASLLMSRALAHWTVTSSGLVTDQMLRMEGREAVLYLDWPYPVQAWYQKRIMEFEPSPFRGPPGLIFTAGPQRITLLGYEFLDAVVDALERVPTPPKFYIQATPDTKLLEIREHVSRYCLTKGWADLSYLIDVFPYYVNKEELLRFLSDHPEWFAVSGDPLGPNTGAVDCAMSGKLTVVWTDSYSQWPARVAQELNVMLGLSMLNTNSREQFTKLVAMFLIEPGRMEAVRNHILEQAKAKAGPFAENSIAQTLIKVMPRLLREAKAAGQDRSRLPDIDAGKHCERKQCPTFTFRECMTNLAESQGMEINRILASMTSAGFPFKGHEAQVVNILIAVQEVMTLDTIAGTGSSRITLVGRWKAVTRDSQRAVWRELGWYEGKNLALKLEVSLYSETTLHNSQIVREAIILMKIARLQSRSVRFQHSFTKLMPVLSRRSQGKGTKETYASVGYALEGDQLLVFSILEAIAEDLRHSNVLSKVRSAFRKEGRVDEHTRALGRAILHASWTNHSVFGIYAGDVSYGNMFPVSWEKIQPSLCPAYRAKLPEPGLIGWCDLGSAIRMSPKGVQPDDEPDALARLSTKPGADASCVQKSIPFLREGDNNIWLISKEKLDECLTRRKTKGLGQTTLGTRGFSDPEMVEKFILAGKQAKAAGREIKRGITDVQSFESYGGGAALYQFFCERRSGISIEDYQAEQTWAALSIENMLATFKKYVDGGVEIQQPDTLTLWANLIWHLMRTENRISELNGLLHPVLSLRTLSQQQREAVESGRGICFAGGYGPKGSPFENMLFPPWTVKKECSMGLGAFAVQPIPPGAPAALYAGVLCTKTNKEWLSVWPPGRENVLLLEGDVDYGFLVGELPLDLLVDLNAPGVCFNAGDAQQPNNLTLNRRLKWIDQTTGILYLAFCALDRGIDKDVPGRWDYKPFSGKGGVDSYFFDDSYFGL